MSPFRTAIVFGLLWVSAAASQPLGIFESQGDLGTTPRSGAAAYDSAKGEYRVTGGGANIWGAQDALHFVWKRVSGDVTLSADVRFEGAGTDPHRKAVLMIRQDLTPGSAYADVAVHGDGLTSLQFRPAAGAATQEIRSTVKGPAQVRIERAGNRFTIFAGPDSISSGPQTVELSDPVYVGIGISSHNAEVLETAVFSNVRLSQSPAAAQQRYRSKITIYDLASRSTSVIYQADQVIEAPNWSRDGKFLLVNTLGSLYTLPVQGGKLSKIEMGPAGYRCNNDHDLSRDGKRLAFSASSPASRQSQVYVANADGSDARLIVTAGPELFPWMVAGR
jgi:Periplasmic component of the Tol biopolymer transport system